MKQSHKTAWSLVIGGAALMAAMVLDIVGGLEGIERVLWSARVRILARPSPATRTIKVILIDQYSLSWASREMKLNWPWPREAYAGLLKFCTRGGAKSVAIDMIFSEPSYMGAPDDAALGEAVANTEAFVGPMFLGEEDELAERRWPDGMRKPAWRLEGLDAWLKNAGAGVRAARANFPVPEVFTNAFRMGDVSGAPDADGQFRRISLFRVFDGTPVLSLGLASWQASAAAAEKNTDGRIAPGRIELGGRTIPIDRDGRALLRFRGKSGAHTCVSAAAVLQSYVAIESGGKPSLDPSIFRDCHVFIGASAPGLMDLRPTPVGRVYPGVELHATALDNFLCGDFFRVLPRGGALALAALFTVLTAMTVILSRRVWQSGVWFALQIGGVLTAGMGLAMAGWCAPVAFPAAGVLMAGGFGLLFNYATEGRQKTFVKQAFRHYLGPEIIEQMLDNPGLLRLGGEKREMTMFFSDIEKFSSFSERLDPPALTALLNEYLSEMGRVIMEEGGYLDKYIGDAVVAFWNAPLPQADHAARAVRTALRAQRRIAERRAEWQEKYGATVRMRIGINTGEVTVGNMGSDDRFNYTILGDAANLAARLEGANKTFHSYILISETTWNGAVAAGFQGRELGRLRVVGRQTPVRVFEPVAEPGSPAVDFTAWNEALRLFTGGRFDEAARLFGAMSGDAVAETMAARCVEWSRCPPETWDGVLQLSEK